MRIVVLGLASEDVGTELRELQISFGDALQATIEHESVSSSVQTLFFTPIVTRPGIGPFPDRISYVRGKPDVNVAINLPYGQWIEGTRAEHVNMLAEALIHGIGLIKDRTIDRETKDSLRRIVELIRRSLTV